MWIVFFYIDRPLTDLNKSSRSLDLDSFLLYNLMRYERKEDKNEHINSKQSKSQLW